MSSLKLAEEYEARAANKVGNIWAGTVALLREKNTTWLSMLHDNAGEGARQRIAAEATYMAAYLTGRRELSQSTLRNELRAIHPDFNPEKHYMKVIRDSKGREKSRTYVTEDKIPAHLVYMRGIWHGTEVHKDVIDGLLKYLELFADALFNLTGSALIKKMTDFSDRMNYIVDPSAAMNIASAVWGEGAEGEDST